MEPLESLGGTNWGFYSRGHLVEGHQKEPLESQCHLQYHAGMSALSSAQCSRCMIHPGEQSERIYKFEARRLSVITIPANPFTFLMQPPQAMFRKCSQPFGAREQKPLVF